MKIMNITIYLASTPTTTELTALPETWIQIYADVPLIKLHAIQVALARQCIVPCVVLDEAKSTWGLLITIQTHDNTFNLANL